ncbi:MAG: hypothetical protein WB786_08080 [Thermoplasmata archaeon]
MDPSRRLTLVVFAVACLVVAGGALIYLGHGNSASTPAASTSSTSEPTTYLNLTIAYDPSMGNYVYTNSIVTVVANTLVVVKITNFDPNVSPLFAPWYNRVIGTVGGSEVVNSGSGPSAVSSLPSNHISHTFSVLDSLYNISVPIPPARSASVPSVVTFELSMNYVEATSWACMCNCMTGYMAAGMYGPLLVA